MYSAILAEKAQVTTLAMQKLQQTEQQVLGNIQTAEQKSMLRLQEMSRALEQRLCDINEHEQRHSLSVLKRQEDESMEWIQRNEQSSLHRIQEADAAVKVQLALQQATAGRGAATDVCGGRTRSFCRCGHTAEGSATEARGAYGSCYSSGDADAAAVGGVRQG